MARRVSVLKIQRMNITEPACLPVLQSLSSDKSGILSIIWI